MRDGIQTDHEFELSPYCDCHSCNELCHFHYGLDDACLLGNSPLTGMCASADKSHGVPARRNLST